MIFRRDSAEKEEKGKETTSWQEYHVEEFPTNHPYVGNPAYFVDPWIARNLSDADQHGKGHIMRERLARTFFRSFPLDIALPSEAKVDAETICKPSNPFECL